MENTMNNRSNIYSRKPWWDIIFDNLALLSAMLFFGVAMHQVRAFPVLKEVPGTSPLTENQIEILSYVIIASEIVVSVLIVNLQTRITGLRVSISLLILFTLYLIYMVTKGGKLPCSCEVVPAQLSWNQEIGLNLIFIALNGAGLQLNSVKSYKK